MVKVAQGHGNAHGCVAMQVSTMQKRKAEAGYRVEEKEIAGIVRASK